MLIKFLDGTSREIADLYGADLRDANLYGADLRSADLRISDLRNADLRISNLDGANLSGASLSGVDLSDANLSDANLSGVDLRRVDLRGANLRGANLRDTVGLDAFCILPAGDLIGYKKLANGRVAKLRIPPDAARVNAYSSRKCRASYVIVLEGSGLAKHDYRTKYAPGLTVTPNSFDPDPRVECSGGIHFFITEQEAKDY